MRDPPSCGGNDSVLLILRCFLPGTFYIATAQEEEEEEVEGDGRAVRVRKETERE